MFARTPMSVCIHIPGYTNYMSVCIHFVIVFVAISFVICVSNRYKLNKNFVKLKAKSAAHYDDLALKTQCTQAQVSKTQVNSVCISS